MVVMVDWRCQSGAYYHKQALLKETTNPAVAKKCHTKDMYKLKIINQYLVLLERQLKVMKVVITKLVVLISIIHK